MGLRVLRPGEPELGGQDELTHLLLGSWIKDSQMHQIGAHARAHTHTYLENSLQKINAKMTSKGRKKKSRILRKKMEGPAGRS